MHETVELHNFAKLSPGIEPVPDLRRRRSLPRHVPPVFAKLRECIRKAVTCGTEDSHRHLSDRTDSVRMAVPGARHSGESELVVTRNIPKPQLQTLGFCNCLKRKQQGKGLLPTKHALDRAQNNSVAVARP